MRDPTQRFSDRVEAYVRYRPTYPPTVIDLLRSECGLNASSVVADLGSGPGNLTALLLPIAARVYAVEPNKEMREAAERLLAEHRNLVSIAASAEETGLPDGSVDLITAGQAFHWFDRSKAKGEFARILRGGRVALIWNRRLTGESDFLRGYEELLLRYSPEYREVNHANIAAEELEEFFAPTGFQKRTFPNQQLFDWEGLTGRVMSSSYVPLEGEPHQSLMSGLRELFDKSEERGHVAFLYETEVFFG